MVELNQRRALSPHPRRARQGTPRAEATNCGDCASPRLDFGRNRWRRVAVLSCAFVRLGRHPLAWSLTTLVIGAWFGAAAAAGTAPEYPSVLILLPGQPGSQGAAALASGVRAVLQAEWSFRVSIEVEHVDVALYDSPEAQADRLRAMYASKYRNTRFDMIVAAFPDPLRFILRTRDELWPGTPVVVCGVDERSVRDLKLPPRFAILTIGVDMEGTLRAARTLLPDTRHVALVGGAGPAEQPYHDMIRRAVSKGGLDLIDLTRLPIAAVLTRVSSLPEHTV